MRGLAMLGPLVAVAAASLVAACGSRREAVPAGADAAASAAAPEADARPAELQLLGPDGRERLRFSAPMMGGWKVTGPDVGPFALVVGIDGGSGLHVVSDAADSASLGQLRSQGGSQVVHDADGKPVARLYVPDATRFDVIGPDGIALVRTSVEPDGSVVARDKAGKPVAVARLDGAVWEVDAPDGTRLATAQGVGDARAPLLIVTLEPLPLPLRVLVAGAVLAGLR